MSSQHLVEINRYAFSSERIGEVSANAYAVSQWPLVYVLSDEARSLAYVGETADTVTRMTAHLRHEHRSLLTVVHLISSEKFNKSATLDIESSLIRYMAADEKFALLNGNLGLADHNYYQKNELYSPIFRQVWDKLRAEGLTRHSLEHLDNSDLFKYSPYKSLSFDQRQGLLGILYALLEDSTRNLIVQGGAGTGKSVLAVFLFKLLQTEDSDLNFREFSTEEAELRDLLQKIRARYGKPSMALVVPMTSFRKTLQKAFSHVAGLSSAMVISPSELAKNTYDFVLVDESHRLRQRKNLGAYFGAFDRASESLGFDKYSCSEVDWVCKQSRKAIFFYDEDQSIKPSDAAANVFERLRAAPDTQVQQLISQFRVRGGTSYVRFIDDLLNNRLGSTPPFSVKDYEFCLFESITDFVEAVHVKEGKYGLSRMIAGYAWPWISKNDASNFDIDIEGKQLRWNNTNEDWINSPNSVAEVGCIHTTQGYDLNYAGIIFGREIGYDRERDEIVIRPGMYFDRNGKQSITDPAELKQFILNIYKTIMLRGIKGTFVYACDPDFRAYLARYIPLAERAPTKVVTLHAGPIKPYINAVPFYDLQAAAGSFNEMRKAELKDWYRVPEHIRIGEGMFACKVIGESMNKIIPNEAVCLFRIDRGGSRNGRIVLVEHLDVMDGDSDSHFTVKEYESTKAQNEDSWAHTQILLKPRSTDPAYQPIVLRDEEEVSRYTVVGEFIQVLA